MGKAFSSIQTVEAGLVALSLGPAFCMMEHGLNLVSFRIEEEGRVVPGMILPKPGSAVARTAGCYSSSVEGVHLAD